jgi:hypothetical protein
MASFSAKGKSNSAFGLSFKAGRFCIIREAAVKFAASLFVFIRMGSRPDRSALLSN